MKAGITIPYNKLMSIITAHQYDLLRSLQPSRLSVEERQSLLNQSATILDKQLSLYGITLNHND